MPATTGSSSVVGLTPAQIRAAYGIDSIAQGTGAGQTIAIIGVHDDPNILADLQAFDSYFHLPDPPSFQKLDEIGGTNYPTVSGSTGWSEEESLDVEWAHAVAPQANIVLIEAASTSNSDVLSAAVNTARNLLGVSVVSMSFSTQESWDLKWAYDTNFSTPTGHAGVTFVASTGDNGSPGSSMAYDYPAVSPTVLAVGGTTLALSGNNYGSETAWSGSGGSESFTESEPSYQTSVQHSGSRQVPDVAFDADPASGAAVYDSYDYGSSTPWMSVGGTSLSAPCWAGLIAIANQLRVANGSSPLDGATQTLPALYSIKGADFHDITTGSNGDYFAGFGYDEVTGLGTPIANKLVPDLALWGRGTVTNPATTTSVTALTSSSVYGQPVTLAATVDVAVSGVNPPTGMVTFLDGSTTLGTATLSRGVAYFSTSALGVDTHAITAVYGGDANFTASTSSPFTEVVSQAATATRLGISAYSSICGQPVTFTATVTAVAPSGAIPTGGTVTFVDQTTSTTLGSATLTGGTAAITVTSLAVGPHTLLATYSGGGTDFAGSGSSTTITPTSIITTIAGNGTYSSSGNGGQATAASFYDPLGVAVDNNGHLFIADAGANCVREVDLTTGVITTVAGSNSYYLGDGGPATKAALNWPNAVAVDNNGHLFIADYNNNRVREVDLTTGIITTVAGNGTDGYSGDGGLAIAAELSRPSGVAVDAAGNLFIADTGDIVNCGNRVREVNLSSGIITTVAGGGPGVTGRDSGDGGPATAAFLASPLSVAVDNSGHLFIATFDDPFSVSPGSRVREVDLASGVITTVAGNGTRGNGGDGGLATATEIGNPTGVMVDSSGNLFFTEGILGAYGTDVSVNRVRKVDLTTGIITTVAGTGFQGRYSGDGGLATTADLNGPAGVAVDSGGNFFIADSGNCRVREIVSGAVRVTVTNNVTVQSSVVNGANGAGTQRSMVKSLVVTFNDVATLDSGAFTIVNKATQAAVGTVLVSADSTSGYTVATLTWSGAQTSYGSLIDGNYQLTIDATKVRDSNTGTNLDGDHDGSPGGNYIFGAADADKFFRLFGDCNGSRVVDGADFAYFALTMNKKLTDAGYLWYFDINNSTKVDGTDCAYFAPQMGKRM